MPKNLIIFVLGKVNECSINIGVGPKNLWSRPTSCQGPRPAPRRIVTEDRWRRSKWPRDAVEDDPVLGILRVKREEQHVIKGRLRNAPKRKGEQSGTRTRVQCGNGSRKKRHLLIECASKLSNHIDGKRPLNSMVSVIATNRKWGEAADETGTRVVIYLTNRWKVRIN